MSTVGPPPTATRTCGWSRRLRNQDGCSSLPPADATTTSVWPSVSGAVSIDDRGLPDRRPTVTSSSDGRPTSVPPHRPPLTFTPARWSQLSVLITTVLVMRR